MTTAVGFFLDFFIGEPPYLPHPIRWIGGVIHRLEQQWNKPGDRPDRKRFLGLMTVFIVVGGTYAFYALVLWLAFKIHPYLGFAAEAYVVMRMLAVKGLADEGKRIYKILKTGDLNEARKWIGYLVSRDTDSMSEEQVIKACIETISENTIDAVVSPLFFTLIGGPALGMAFKAASTLDSMIAYKNERYIDFGRAAAYLDDWLNFIPARLTGGLTVVAAFLLRLDYKRSAYVLIRDRFNHSSPNSPYGEASAAGALRIQLGGQATYFGVTEDKPTFGDPIEPITKFHINSAISLMQVTSLLALIVLEIAYWVVLALLQ